MKYKSYILLCIFIFVGLSTSVFGASNETPDSYFGANQTIHWHFNESSGTTIVDSKGVRNYTGINIAGDEWQPRTDFGNALALNQGNSEYLYQLANGINMVTGFFCGWVYTNTSKDGFNTLFHQEGGGGMYCQHIAAQGGIWCDVPAGTDFTFITTRNGQWTHFCLGYDGTNVIAYVNGTLRGNYGKGTLSALLGAAKLSFGANYAGGATLNGSLDDFVFYNQTNLTLFNVSTIYNASFGGGTPPAGSYDFEVELNNPINDTMNNTNQWDFSYNITHYLSNISNCSLYINGTLNMTNSSIVTNSTPNYFNNINISDGSYYWTVGCWNGSTNLVYPSSSNWTFYVDTVTPIVTADDIRLNKTYLYDMLNGTINVTDSNLYSVNFSLDGWQNYYQYDINATFHSYNYSLNFSNNLTGIHTITYKACDGHTSQYLKEDWKTETIFDGVRFKTGDDWYSVTSDNNDLFDEIRAIREKDRYSWEYDKSFFADDNLNVYKFIIKSNQKIYKVSRNSNYNGWLVIPNLGQNGRWIDFNIEGKPNLDYTITQITPYEVEVLITPIKDLGDITKFESTGELNCVSYDYLVYKYNFTDYIESPILENEFNTIYFNLSVNNSFIYDVDANLSYNYISYTPDSKSNASDVYMFGFNVYSPNLTVNITNLSVYFNYSLEGYTNKTNYSLTYRNLTQVVYNLRIDNCTDFTTYAMNFTYRNESDDDILTADMDANIIYSYNNLSKNYSVSMDGRTNFSLCLSHSWANISSDILIQYGAADYDTREYQKDDYYIDNSTDLINLYLLMSGLSTDITIHVIDTSDNDLSDVFVEVEKFIISTGTYNIVATGKTDTDGNIIFPLEYGSTYYRFKLYQSGELKLTTPTFKLSSTTLEYVLGESYESHLANWIKVKSISGNISYANATNVFTFVWDDSNNYASGICLNITDGNQSFYSNCSTNNTGTMTYTVTSLNRTYSAIATARVGGYYYSLDDLFIDLRSFWRNIGANSSILLAMIVFLLISLLGIKSPPLAIGTGIVATIFLFFIGLAPIALGSLIGVVAVGMILMLIMRDRA